MKMKINSYERHECFSADLQMFFFMVFLGNCSVIHQFDGLKIRASDATQDERDGKVS